jgi:hypothetical protein
MGTILQGKASIVHTGPDWPVAIIGERINPINRRQLVVTSKPVALEI